MPDFLPAMPGDADVLARVQKAAFDALLAGAPPGSAGPSGYDAPAWQADRMGDSEYWAIKSGGRIVGGLVALVTGGTCHVHRVFVDPACQGKGIGRAAFAFLEARHPEVERYTLDTPAWATGNHRFYEALGYVCVRTEYLAGEGFSIRYYEKRPGNPGGPGRTAGTNPGGTR